MADCGPRTTSIIARAATLLALTSLLAGCAGGGASAPGNAFASVGGATVAFESIDGPPQQVFDRMVSVLEAETKQRNLAVVSRQGTASFRVRSYLAAQVSRGRTSIAWVWDVYDANQQRVGRFNGTEQSGKLARDGIGNAWASADDAVLRRIAQAGLNGISGLMNGSIPPDASAPAEPETLRRGPAIASADDSPADAATSPALSFSAR